MRTCPYCNEQMGERIVCWSCGRAFHDFNTHGKTEIKSITMLKRFMSKHRKRLLLCSAFFYLSALVLSAAIAYQSIRSHVDSEYIPPVVLKRLYENTAITNDMRLPLSALKDLFALPPDERDNSSEYKLVDSLFNEKTGTSGIYRRFIRYADNGELLFMRIVDTLEYGAPYIDYGFASSKPKMQHHYLYLTDGRLTRYTILDYSEISYMMANENNEKITVHKYYFSMNRIEFDYTPKIKSEK